jgi:hypothetical protein
MRVVQFKSIEVIAEEEMCVAVFDPASFTSRRHQARSRISHYSAFASVILQVLPLLEDISSSHLRSITLFFSVLSARM